MEASTHSSAAVSYSRFMPWLILAVVCADVLYPGEVFFQSKYLLIFVSILAALVSFIEANRGEANILLRQLALTFLPLVCFVPALLLSINHSRSQEVFVLFFSYACLLFSLRLLKLELSFVIASLLLLSLVTLFIDGHGLYQHFRGLEQLKAQVSGSAAIDESLRLGILSRIRTERVFANFALPNTLAGFLTMTLPLTSCLLGMGFRPSPFLNACPGWSRVLQIPWVKLLLMVELALSLWVLALTQSFGGWLGLLASLVAVGALWIRQNPSVVNRRMLWTGIATLSLLGACWAVWIGNRRGFSLWDLKAAENPIILRSLTFKTTLDILRDFPITGVGLGNYGTINPRYQILPQLVTQYAHNTFLQLLCEGGVLLMGCLLLNGCILWRYKFKRIRNATWQRPFEPLQLGLGGALTAWTIHNSLDIDFYFPSLGALGILLLGLSLKLSLNEENKPLFERKPRLGRWYLAAVFTTVLCVGSLLALRGYLSQMFYELAIASAESKDITEANRFALWAVSIQKDAPKTLLAGKLAIQKMSLDGRESALLLRTLRDTFETASRLDPYNAHFHYELSRIYRKLGEAERARKSQERAMLLFPSEPTFKAP